jgi:hypothetical protein
MIGETNLKAIKKGDTYIIPFEFYADECESTPVDVSTYIFKLMAKDSLGVTQFTWNNADFVSVATNKRTVTLSSVTTATYNIGEFNYELQVDIGTGVYTWMIGYIEVQNQITS